MLADDFETYRKPQPCAVGLRGEEGVEDFGKNGFRNAGAVVLKGQFDKGLRLAIDEVDDLFGGNIQPLLFFFGVGLLGEGFNGVEHDVEKDLSDLVAVGFDRREFGRDIDIEIDVIGFEVLRQKLCDGLNDFGDAHAHDFRLSVARKGEGFFDELIDAVDFCADASNVLIGFGIGRNVEEDGLHH